ncbi:MULTISPECIES: hypothetical protein [Burkholderia]|uniref:hypothetical protein n=1 Tax=Burkholderia TaxID=32008 RepID=UPI00114CC7A2|nr:hypothetical protein [Burkholderia contaminans]MBK1926201.1 hypothetical protein [Burkholderia contaminans]MBK1950212.1 hypothetical protein [Burkholderia contaminans]MEB4626151.1 hypothetical protein [Burkholderia contaminans]MEB4644547.1 hypothetical protein [Burkholderia contaminans]MEB4729353.1 hypothetical protein [Burkholderia contaminans]
MMGAAPGKPQKAHSIEVLFFVSGYLPGRWNLSAFLWARRLNNRLSTRLRESLAEQDSKLVHR